MAGLTHTQLCAKGVQCSIKEYLMYWYFIYNMIRAVGEEVGNSVLRKNTMGRYLHTSNYRNTFFLELPLQYNR